jgi:hypothetical protein
LRISLEHEWPPDVSKADCSALDHALLLGLSYNRKLWIDPVMKKAAYPSV